MKRLLFGVAVALIITGCATQATRPDEAKEAPNDRVYFKDRQGATGEVVVIRDSGLFGAGCVSTIYIDGEIAAALYRTEKATFKVEEGEHIIGLTSESSGLCAFNTDLYEKDFRIKSGERKLYRASITSSATPLIMPTTQAH